LDRFGDQQHCGKAFRLRGLNLGGPAAAHKNPTLNQDTATTTISPQHRHRHRLQPGLKRPPAQVEAVLAALVWDGWVSQAEGNANFVLRGAA
jgi:hypothetical protein